MTVGAHQAIGTTVPPWAGGGPQGPPGPPGTPGQDGAWTLVYDPAGVQAGNVYTDFNDLYTAALAIHGLVLIYIPASCTLPVRSGGGAPYDLQGRMLFVGRKTSYFPDVTVTLDDGVGFYNFFYAANITFVSQNTLGPVCIIDAGATSKNVTLDCCAFDNNTAQPFFAVDAIQASIDLRTFFLTFFNKLFLDALNVGSVWINSYIVGVNAFGENCFVSDNSITSSTADGQVFFVYGPEDFVSSTQGLSFFRLIPEIPNSGNPDLIFGGNFAGGDVNKYLAYQGRGADAPIAALTMEAQAIPLSNNDWLQSISWQSETADATTQLGVYLDGALVDTVTLLGPTSSGIGNAQLTVPLRVFRGNTVMALQFAGGTAPGKIVASLNNHT